MGWIRTKIEKGDLVKVINPEDGNRYKFPEELKLGETYEVVDVKDDYFDGAYLLIKVGDKTISAFPTGRSGDKFEIVNREIESKNNSDSI